jgi:4-hydroxybenzoate polyprenyltransferase
MLAKLFKVSRPISWINTAFPFAATYLVAGGDVDTFLIIGSLFFLIPYNLLMYGVNDVYDYESDIRNPRKNSIEGAAEARSFHPIILRAAYGLAVPFVAALLIVGDWRADLVLLTVTFFVIAYSLKGLRFKEVPFLDSITSSIHFVGPMIYAAAVLDFPATLWPFIFAFFLWGLASHAFGAVQDVIPDRKGGLKSIATVIGARATVWFSAMLYSIAIIVTIAQGGGAIVVGLSGVAYLVNVLPYFFITDRTSAKANTGWRRFIWLNYGVGAVLTVTLLLSAL